VFTPPAGVEPTAYRRGLGALLALYVMTYGGLLVHTRGLPYVMDNNESFSAFVHASNLYHFPIARTVGLTDEAFSPHEAAHPYVYTHQGNFPRLYAFALYVLGARTVESQIIITTFTVGVVALIVMYRYFVAVAGALFATIACAIALTDYVFFIQWHVNTFRVWHALFFFLALLCVHGVDGTHSRRWLVATVFVFAAMFYFELVFATFVAIMAGLYAGMRFAKRPRVLVFCWAAQLAGAALAVAVLVAQLVSYLGWSDFVQDLRLTYSVRNFGAGDASSIDKVREFVESRRLVFWFNFAPQEYGRSPGEVLASIARGYFTVFTPTLWYCVAILVAGWTAGLRSPRPRTVVRDEPVRRVSSARGISSDILWALLLVVALTRFLVAVLSTDVRTGSVSTPGGLATSSLIVPVLVAALILAAGLTRVTTGRWWNFGGLIGRRGALAVAVLLAAEHILVNSQSLFDPTFAPLWLRIHEPWLPAWAAQLLVVGVAIVAVLLTLDGIPHSGARRPAFAAFLVSGCIAYTAIYALSPGYIHSGYLARSTPFFSFVLYGCLALVIHASWRTASHSVARASALAATYRQRPRAVALRTAAVCAALPLVLGLAFWAKMQTTYAQLLPATHFTFMKRLAEPPFRGASFAASTYAAPVFAFTGQWAYFDTRLAQPDGGLVEKSASGYRANRDADSYLWLADRRHNADYLRPSYFLCFAYQDLGTAMRRIMGTEKGCALAGVVKYADSPEPMTVADTIVARDGNDEFAWAIVKLDWSRVDSANRPAAGSGPE
jgi:hypothetical protein